MYNWIVWVWRVIPLFLSIVGDHCATMTFLLDVPCLGVLTDNSGASLRRNYPGIILEVGGFILSFSVLPPPTAPITDGEPPLLQTMARQGGALYQTGIARHRHREILKLQGRAPRLRFLLLDFAHFAD